MKNITIIHSAIILFIAILGFFLFRSQNLFLSHEAVVKATIADLLEDTNHQFPKHDANLTDFNSDASQPVTLYKVTNWQLEVVKLENHVSIGQSFLDDDPVYGLKARLRVSYQDGSETVLSWQSWRYGIVLGSLVLSLGDGPPGEVVASAPANE